MSLVKLFDYLSHFLTPSRLAAFDSVLNNRTNHLTVVSQDIYQEHNAGALVRTCDCLGIQNISVIQRNYTYKLSSGMAQGAEKWVDIKYYDEEEDGIAHCIKDLRERGYQIVATTPHFSDTDPEHYNIKHKTALFFGRERDGLSQKIINDADEHLKIPMIGFTESYNVSVSAAIILYILTTRMRNDPEIDWHLNETEILYKKIDWSMKTIRNSQCILREYLKKNPEADHKLLRKITDF